MSLRDRIRGFFSPAEERAVVVKPRGPLIDTLLPWMTFGGQQYPLQTLLGEKQMVPETFEGMVRGAYQSNGVVFACELARVSLFAEARFQWRRLQSGRPGDYFWSQDLALLESPWPKATTGDLLSRMLVYADFGDNCFVVRRPGPRLRPLRPDWVTVILGSLADKDVAAWDVDADILGIFYQPGGPAGGRTQQLYMADEIALFAPIPDPSKPAGLGMGWVKTVLAEIMGDKAATAHKLAFFENGATPNVVVTVDSKYTDEQIGKLRQQIEENHTGVSNAYSTLIFRSAIEKWDVVGKDMEQMDFKSVQGAGETRIAAAAGVPPVVVGLSEGLQGSSLNAGNFQASMRRFADLTMRPLWRNVAGSLESVIDKPKGSPCQLWYDDRDIPALKDDIKAAAEVRGLDATAMRTLRDGGWDPDAVVDAVTSGDMKRLIGKHDGTKPVQQQPGDAAPKPPDATPDQPATPNEAAAAILAAVTRRSTP